MKIFLIGLPCCGKTTIGKQVAEQLKIPFIDLDEIIIQSEQMTVNEIFLKKGETYFRELESNELKRIAQSDTEFLMATGGGAPCFADNIEVINKFGKSIFLNLAVEEIVKRLDNINLSDRPLLASISKEDRMLKFKELLKQREKFYRVAHFTLSGLAITADQVVRIIKKKVLPL